MNRFYQRPLSSAWRTARSRAALVEPPSMPRRPVAMTLHKPVIYGPAIEAAQASSVPSSAMRSPLPAPSKAIPSGGPFPTPSASPFGSIEPATYSRSIAMITLHKPERATYSQAVEAQLEFANITCITDPPSADCYGAGTLCCCC